MQENRTNAFIARLRNSSVVAKLCVVLAVLSCLVYINTLKNGYVLDDVIVVTENNYVQQGISGIPLLLRTTHYKGFQVNSTNDYYRPLSLVMFAIQYQLFGLNPAAGHAFNILLFAACVIALFLFLYKLFNKEKILVAFIAALLFAFHPIHTEVVANIKSCDELLCFFFAFLSLNLYANYVKQGKLHTLLSGSLCLFLAALSKETVVTFLGIIPFVFFLYLNANKKRSWHITISAVIAIAVFVLLWWTFMGATRLQTSGQIKFMFDATTGIKQTMADLSFDIFILGYYLKFLFVPYPLNSDYGNCSVPFEQYGTALALIAAIAYLSLIYIAFRRLYKYKRDPWAFSIIFYLISISIFSNMPFVLKLPYANRFEFFASVGFCLAFALAIEQWVLKVKNDNMALLKNKRLLAVLVPVLLCYAVMTIARNADWKDNLTLVNTDLAKSPGSYIMQYKEGLELQNKYDTETDSGKRAETNAESISHFSASLAINPDYTESNADIGVAYMRMKNYDSAAYYFKRTLAINPQHFNAANNLGTLCFDKDQFKDAITYYTLAVSLFPKAEQAWYNMGICYARLQQPDSSIICMKKVIGINPALDDHKAFGNVAIMYQMTGQADSAAKYEQLTRKYFPGFSLPHMSAAGK